MAIRVTLQCGDASKLRARLTPEGYTHDWEVFVKGVDNADISQYIDKVIFNLHETFQKPKRILKEPPYIVKESGYAGFEIPIDIYLKNKDEPKRIQIQYDLVLQPRGPAINHVIRHHEVFANPNEEFRKKLLKGGGVPVSHPEDTAEKGEFKMVPPMVSKPKLSGTDAKKHRVAEVRSSDEFSHLFGNIMTLPAKVSPESKRSVADKVASSKSSLEKSERAEKPAKQKHSPHKEKKKEKSAEDRKEKKDRPQTKEKDRSKEKAKRPLSPAGKEEFPTQNAKKSCLASPPKKHAVSSTSTALQKPPSPKPKSEKQHKKMSNDKEKEKLKDANFKVPVEERMFDRKKKKHREDKSKERKDKEKEKEHERAKDPTKPSDRKLPKSEKHEKSEKDKSADGKPPKDEKKSPKHQKEREKIRPEKSNRTDASDKPKDAHADREKQKHKHKRKEKKERAEELADKDKQKVSGDKKNSYSALPSVNPLSTLLAEMPERDSSDSAPSVDEDSTSPTKSLASMETEPAEALSAPVPSIEITKPPSPRSNADAKPEADERSRKDKTKNGRGEEREGRKRKRKTESASDEHSGKRERDSRRSLSPSVVEPVSSSQSPISVDVHSPYVAKEAPNSQLPADSATEGEQVAPDSTNNTFIEPEVEPSLVFSDEYVSQLKELQQNIMTLQDNQELQRVVQVIAETGQYEVTRKTFDFDLCALDRTTVQRLQQFFSAS